MTWSSLAWRVGLLCRIQVRGVRVRIRLMLRNANRRQSDVYALSLPRAIAIAPIGTPIYIHSYDTLKYVDTIGTGGITVTGLWCEGTNVRFDGCWHSN